MGFFNFIHENYFTKVKSLSVDFDAGAANMVFETYDEKGGNIVAPPMQINIDLSSEKQSFKNANYVPIPEPLYPQICEDREAMVPMWTEETTQEERDEYDAAKAQYDIELSQHKESVAAARAHIDGEAEKNNKYIKYFTKQLERAMKQAAYGYAKEMPIFAGVIDDVE